jgi:hypothetical protein
MTPGTLIEFSAWIQTWMCFDYNNCDYGHVSDQPSDMHLRIGIDPTGGTVPTSTNIIWSPEAPAFDHWTYFSVRSTALSNTVTMFTHSRPEWSYAHNNNDVYLDDANLVVIGPLPAEFSSIQPAQPELAQPTTVQVSSYYLYTNTALMITDPHSGQVIPTGSAVFGSAPYVWTWQFTPTVSGAHVLTFTANQLTTPLTTTVVVTSTASVYSAPPAPPIGVPVTVQARTYYPYANGTLALTDPEGAALTPDYWGQTGEPPFVWTWAFTPVITGTHIYTFTANGLEVPGRGLVFVGGYAIYLPVIFKQ